MIKVKKISNAVPISHMSSVILNGCTMKASPWLSQLNTCYLLNALLVSNSPSTAYWWRGNILCHVMSHTFRMYQITGKDGCCQ